MPVPSDTAVPQAKEEKGGAGLQLTTASAGGG